MDNENENSFEEHCDKFNDEQLNCMKNIREVAQRVMKESGLTQEEILKLIEVELQKYRKQIK